MGRRMFGRDSSREGFIDRHQLWPFYRRRRYCDETMEAVREVWREMDEGYTADDYPGAVRSRNIRSGPDIRYTLVERPRYLRGRERMAEHGYDLDDLDYVIGMLCHGDALPSRYRNHKLKGDRRGYMECHIAFDWVLVYQYNNSQKELILYAIDTGTHRDIFRD
jgi:mRNA interferase YafQ